MVIKTYNGLLNFNFASVVQSTKGPSRTLLHENVQIDRDSVQRVIPECTDSGFCIFSGEELHPEVDKYIRYVAGTECSNEVVLFILSIYIFICVSMVIHVFIYVLAWIFFGLLS